MKTNRLFGTHSRWLCTAIVAAIALSMTALSLAGCGDGGGGVGNPTAPTITTTSLPGGTQGTPYTATLAASGTAPITWSVEPSGALPDGLSLSSTGAITGTPTTAGTSNFTVKATNAIGSDTKYLSITIAPTESGGGGGSSKETAIPLTVNQWTDGDLPTSSDVQWFTFTATAITQYIHVELGTLTNLYVQVYASDGTAVENETNLSGVTGSNARTSRTLTSGQTYYIKVIPYAHNSGTYRIGFNTLTTAPPIKLPSSGAIPLTVNQWANGDLPTSDSVQWFTFTATATTQSIHVELGTLTNLYVWVYASDGTAVGSETRLYGTGSNTISRSPLTAGQTYYIKVRPYSSSYSGTYRIAFGIIVPPGISPIPLTENQWTDGSLPTSNDRQWFTFTATASTQYIHASAFNLNRLYVQVYDSGSATVGSETNLYGTGSTNAWVSRTLTIGDTYYIRVRPYTSYTGTYRIGFNASSTAPTTVQLPSNAIPLTESQWADGDLPTSGSVQWFTFTATASTQWIHAAFGTLTSLYVQVYDSGGATVGTESLLQRSDARVSRTLTMGQTYYIRVRPVSSSDSGTYQIGFTATIAPPPGAVPLTENQWAGGSLPTSSDVQWFTFTATASTQYIHASFGTLTSLVMQVYDSNGATEGSQTNLDSSSGARTSLTLTSGQTYYIRVWPYGSYSGTYKIAFNTSATAPASP